MSEKDESGFLGLFLLLLSLLGLFILIFIRDKTRNSIESELA